MSLKDRQRSIKGQIYSSRFLSSIKLQELENFLEIFKNHKRKIIVRVNVRISKIMRTPIKKGVRTYAKIKRKDDILQGDFTNGFYKID